MEMPEALGVRIGSLSPTYLGDPLTNIYLGEPTFTLTNVLKINKYDTKKIRPAGFEPAT